MSKKTHPLKDADWNYLVGYTRFHTMRTLRCIRNGAVEEEDLDKLQNLLLNTLALMELQGQKAWDMAKLRALFLEQAGSDPDVKGIHPLPPK